MAASWTPTVEAQTAKFLGSAWQQGATAAHAGKTAKDNPYKPSQYDWVTWMNGWTWARYQDAREEFEL